MNPFLRRAALALLVLGVHRSSIALESSAHLHCDTQAPAASFALPNDDRILNLVVDDEAQWLEWQDAGQETTTDAPNAITIPQPLRLGWHWLPVRRGSEISVRRVEINHARGDIKVILHCVASDALQSQLAWLKRAGEIGALVDTPVDSARLTRELDDIQSLHDSGSDGVSRAIALHFRAEVLGANDRNADASDAFATAEQAWSALAERERAQAAHLGRVDELKAMAAYQSVLDLTPALSTVHGEQNYFSVRIENPRCQTLQQTGRSDEANECFEWLLSSYKNLDERSEYVVALQAYANLLRERGNLERAEQLGTQGLSMASGPSAPMVRGRLQLMLADITRRRGEVTQSLTHAKFALDEFAHAGGGAGDWQASTLLFLAILYNQLGADDEAATALGEAVSHISARDAPARMAVAMNVFADIETATDHTDSALWWRRAAEETYARLNMPQALNAARVQRLELQEKKGDLSTVARDLANHAPDNSLLASSWLLLGADLALQQGRSSDAAAMLKGLNEKPLTLRDTIRLSELRASYRNRSGDMSGALDELSASARHIDELAARTRSPILRHVIARQKLPLQRMALGTLLERHIAQSATDTEIAWSWLAPASIESMSDPADVSSAKTAEQFDRAVAQELLAVPSKAKSDAETGAQRELLALLTQPAAPGVASNSTLSPIPLVSFQHALNADMTVVAYLDGGSRGAVLVVTHDRATIVDSATPDRLRTSIAALRESLQTPESQLLDVQTAADALSAQLLGSLPLTAPPQHLYVMADGLLDGIAWGTLKWPGQRGPLIETTSVSLLRLHSDEPTTTAMTGTNSVAVSSAPLHVLIAAQEAAHDAALPTIAGASAEPALIRTALIRNAVSGHQITVTSATRPTVLDALDDSGSWVHIAAHGIAQPQRIGYSGLWLQAPGSGTSAPFLSWLDILDRDVRADLVVLNACQLGDSGIAITGNLSFAAAVSRAGAKQVVAALWPISDAASALWVPEFYVTLNDDPQHDAAHALRMAQLRLRASRAFSHPFYWAGMQAQTRLAVAP